MGPNGCPETLVRNYHFSPRNSPEERSSVLVGVLIVSDNQSITPVVQSLHCNVGDDILLWSPRFHNWFQERSPFSCYLLASDSVINRESGLERGGGEFMPIASHSQTKHTSQRSTWVLSHTDSTSRSLTNVTQDWTYFTYAYHMSQTKHTSLTSMAVLSQNEHILRMPITSHSQNRSITVLLQIEHTLHMLITCHRLNLLHLHLWQFCHSLNILYTCLSLFSHGISILHYSRISSVKIHQIYCQYVSWQLVSTYKVISLMMTL